MLNVGVAENLDSGKTYFLYKCQNCGKTISLIIYKGNFVSSLSYSGIKKLCRECLPEEKRKKYDHFVESLKADILNLKKNRQNKYKEYS